MQLDHDEEIRPMHAMYATLDPDLEVQRTIKRAKLIAFLCLSSKGLFTVSLSVWTLASSSSEAWKTTLGTAKFCPGEVEELESCLPARRMWRILTAVAENAGDGDGSRRFEWIKTSEGHVLTATWRYEDYQRVLEAERVKTGNHGELLEIIEHMKMQQNGLTMTLERKNRMTKGVSEEIRNKFFKEVLDLEKSDRCRTGLD